MQDPPTSPRLTILLVEDHEGTRHGIETALTDWGHTVFPTSSALEALNLLAQHPEIHLMITDWIMPEVNGLELCQMARSLERDAYLHILVLTARDGSEDRARAIDSGADAFLLKTAHLSQLRARIEEIQGRAGANA